MLYQRYKNGSGKIFGETAEIDGDSLLDRQSFIGDTADIWQSKIFSSRVQGKARLRNAIVENTSVGVAQGTGLTEVVHSHLVQSDFWNGQAFGAYLENSTVRHSVRIAGHGKGVKVINSTLENEATVTGEAVLYGLTIGGKMRIGEGIWERPPRYFYLRNDIADIGITESVNGQAFVGCTSKKMNDWIKKRYLWQKASGWTDEMITTLKLLFESWLDVRV